MKLLPIFAAGVLASCTFIANATLNGITNQIATNQKDLLVYQSFGPNSGQVYASKKETYSIAAGSSSFTNNWNDSASFGGVNVQGNSLFDYSFIDNTFNFSTSSNIAQSGFFNNGGQDQSAVAYSYGQISIEFVLTEAAKVYFDVSGTAENNGNSSGGGTPIFSAGLEVKTGTDPLFGDLYDVVEGSLYGSDNTIGNGAETGALSYSQTLAAGSYRLLSASSSLILYHQWLFGPFSSQQTSSLNLTARFESLAVIPPPSTPVPEPSVLGLLCLGLVAMRYRIKSTAV